MKNRFLTYNKKDLKKFHKRLTKRFKTSSFFILSNLDLEKEITKNFDVYTDHHFRQIKRGLEIFDLIKKEKTGKEIKWIIKISPKHHRDIL